MPRYSQRDILPSAIKFRLLENFDPTTGEVFFTRESDGTRFLTINLRDGVLTILHETLAFTTTIDEAAALTMSNSDGTQKVNLRISTGGFGFLDLDQIYFNANTGNTLKESFGVVAQLADTAGTHAFRIQDSDGVEAYRFASDGSFFQGKAKSFVLKGNIADPGSQGADTAAIFVQENGGKDQLRVEFATGASVLIAAEP